MSNQMKHTRGEWFLAQEKPTYAVLCGDPDDPNVVCEVRPNNFMAIQSDTEIEANALLIAAAPDLLNACEIAVSAIESLMDELGGKRATDWGKVNDAMVALGQAHAKAKGQSK